MVMIAKHTRRLFLRGLGGTVLAAPFLGSVVARVAKGNAAPVQSPRRLIIMFTHYGCLTDRWFPLNSHGPLSATDLQGTSLEVLAPHVGKLLMPRGIRAMNEWTTDVSLGQGNDPLVQVCGSYFTCAPVTPHSSDPFDITNTAAKFNAKPILPSLDHVCAQQLSADGLPLLLRVSGANDNPQTGVSYSAPETQFPGVGNPAQALSLLGFSGDGASAGDYKSARRQSVLDLVKDDLETLERVDMSAADKQKLAAWKELLHETGGMVASAQCRAEALTEFGLTEDNLLAWEAPETDRVASKITDTMDGADLFSNLAVLSALCDPTRVVLLKYPGNYVFRGLGLSMESHNVSKRISGTTGTGACAPDANEMVTTIDRFYAEKFAHLVRQLDSIEEGDGTVLDNTAAVWFQQCSDGAAVNLNNLPILQAGSCGGYFKTGWAVNVDDGASDLTRGNSSRACEETGEILADKSTGTPVEFANAPINKYYCNLMNAIGVKAGADGFPAVGGTEAVTHFGMYDDTHDFASGGDNPPKINSPGEFAELRG